MPQYVFSTGILLVGDVDATLTEADNKIGILENVTFDTEASRKDLFAPPAESLYPVATGFYNAKCMLKSDHGEFDPDLLVRIAGAALSAGVYTVDSLSKPTYCKVQFIAQDVDENPITITLFRALATKLPFKFGQDDFAKISLEFEGYPSLTQNSTAGNPIVFTVEVGAAA